MEGRLFAFGKEGLVAIEGFEGSVVGRVAFGRLPAPPSEGREPPIGGSLLDAPPGFGIDGREFTFPSDGFETFGLDTLGALGLVGMLGLDMFGMLGRAPPPPKFPIEGLAPPPPPPRPRCANADGEQKMAVAKATSINDRIRVCLTMNIGLLLKVRMDYLPAAGGSLTTLI